MTANPPHTQEAISRYIRMAIAASPTQSESAESAREAGLRYVTDTSPGIHRQPYRGKFRFLDAHGEPVRDEATLERIQALAIPPAWQDVWICPHARGHIQATGRDARGRKQYRYHAEWRKVRDSAKYDRMVAFGKALPKIRRRVQRDLARRGLPREKVLATVTHLLESTLIRVGNETYARENHSFGLTTMRVRHLKSSNGKLRFCFRGKSGKRHAIDIRNPRLARIVKQCRDLPGYELFQYVDDDGERVPVSSTEVNEYLREIGGGDFSAKDFRTWAGTVLAARALQEFEKFTSEAEARRNMLAAIEAVARMLGNTPAICRKCYVHPIILDTYLDGTLVEQLAATARRKLAREIRSLRPEEAAVLMFLQHTLKKHPK